MTATIHQLHPHHPAHAFADEAVRLTFAGMRIIAGLDDELVRQAGGIPVVPDSHIREAICELAVTLAAFAEGSPLAQDVARARVARWLSHSHASDPNGAT